MKARAQALRPSWCGSGLTGEFGASPPGGRAPPAWWNFGDVGLLCQAGDDLRLVEPDLPGRLDCGRASQGSSRQARPEAGLHRVGGNLGDVGLLCRAGDDVRLVEPDLSAQRTQDAEPVAGWAGWFVGRAHRRVRGKPVRRPGSTGWEFLFDRMELSALASVKRSQL